MVSENASHNSTCNNELTLLVHRRAHSLLQKHVAVPLQHFLKLRSYSHKPIYILSITVQKHLKQQILKIPQFTEEKRTYFLRPNGAIYMNPNVSINIYKSTTNVHFSITQSCTKFTTSSVVWINCP